MNPKRIVGITICFFFLGTLVLKVSSQWIPVFWRLPSQFQGKILREAPPKLNFKIPGTKPKGNGSRSWYFKTDELGAFTKIVDGLPVKAWILGDIRTARLNTPPENRWSAMLKWSNRNFGFPGFDPLELNSRVSKLLTEETNRPQWIFIGDFSIVSPLRDFRLPDFSPFWVWNRPAASHPLYECLCFFWASPFCAVEFTSNAFAEASQKPSVDLTRKQIDEQIKFRFSNFSETLDTLRSSNIELLAMIFPVESREPNWKSLFNERLRLKFSEMQIPIIDIEKCSSEAPLSGPLVDKGGYWPEQEKLFARCANDYLEGL